MEAIKLARSILQAAEEGKGIDITIFTYKKLKNGKARMVTSK